MAARRTGTCTPQQASLRERARRIEARAAVPAGGKNGRVPGYATPAERHAKTIRLKVLKARLARTERRLASGRVSVTRGGRALLRKRLNLAAAGADPGTSGGSSGRRRACS